MKNTIKLLVAIIFVAWTLLMMSTVVFAQSSFHSFMNDVNTSTGITTNDYMSNVKKATILGFPNNTLWEIYSNKLTIKKVIIPEIVIAPQKKVTIAPVTIDTMQYIHTINNLAQIATEYEVTIEKLEKELSLRVKEVKSLNDKHYGLQQGDVLVSNKRYTSIKCVRNGKTLSASQFDKLVDLGVISPLKNKMWIVNPISLPITQMGLGDGFIFILVCLMLLLGGAKIVAKPKESKELIEYKSKCIELGLEVQKLSKANSTLSKENETLQKKLNPQYKRDK